MDTATVMVKDMVTLMKVEMKKLVMDMVNLKKRDMDTDMVMEISLRKKKSMDTDMVMVKRKRRSMDTDKEMIKKNLCQNLKSQVNL